MWSSVAEVRIWIHDIAREDAELLYERIMDVIHAWDPLISVTISDKPSPESP